MSRDWRSYLNTLVHCDGCGRFGLPTKNRTGPRSPNGWKMIYQPHASAPPMLLACGDACAARVREAIAKGPVLEPLEFAHDVVMPAEVREAMFADFREYLGEEVEESARALFDKLFGPIEPPAEPEPAEEEGGVVLPFRRRSTP